MGQEVADYQPIITSHDGYSSFLLVVDAFTRASFCLFLTKSKSPPVDTITMSLENMVSPTPAIASSAPIKATNLLVWKLSGKCPKRTTILLKQQG